MRLIPPPLALEPYRCRLRYLQIGLGHALANAQKESAAAPLSLPKRPIRAGAKLLAPFILLLALGPILGVVARPLISGLRAVVPPALAEVGLLAGAAALVLALASLPAMALRAGWRKLQACCHEGWRLSQAKLAGAALAH